MKELIFKKKLFETKKFLLDDRDENDSYTFTLFVCLLHELCSQLKLFIKEKSLKSPNIINDPYDDYNELELENGESGRIMEYYFSQDINKIKFLKFSFSLKKDLYNHNLWTDENFDKLNLIIENLIEDYNSQEYLSNEIDYFPNKKIENDFQNDLENSSPEVSEDEKFNKKKKSIKNKTFKKDLDFEDFLEFIDVKPLVKY